MTYTWSDVLNLVREAKRHKDLEVRSAILADICNAVDELDKDKEAMVEQAFKPERWDVIRDEDYGS